MNYKNILQNTLSQEATLMVEVLISICSHNCIIIKNFYKLWDYVVPQKRLKKP